MIGLDDARRESLERRYALSEQAEWRKLLQHFDFSEQFAFVVLLVPDVDGAILCRYELERQLEGEGQRLQAIELPTPTSLRQLPEHFLDTPIKENTTCLWVAAVAPDYAKDYADWRDAWQSALARLNAFRNPIRKRFPLALVFAGAPWLQELLRETAPDLWSVRTLVVRIEPVAHPDNEFVTAPQLLESTVGEGPDPVFALQQAGKLRGVPGKELALADLLHRAGEGFESQENWREAEKAYGEALEFKHSYAAPPTSLLLTLNELSWTCHVLGQTRRSLDLAEKSLSLARQVSDHFQEGKALNNLALALVDMGEVQQAIAFYKQALDVSREINDKQAEAITLNNFGIAYKTLGETQRAIDFYEKALAMSREIGDQVTQRNSLGNLGATYRILGETRRAIEFDEQALAMSRGIGNRRAEGNALSNLGIAYMDMGEVQRAIEYWKQALDIHREIGERRKESIILSNLGVAYAKLGQIQRAIEFFEQRLMIAREIEDRNGEAQALWYMSLTRHEMGKKVQATTLAENALKIYEEIESPYTTEVRQTLERWSEESNEAEESGQHDEDGLTTNTAS